MLCNNPECPGGAVIWQNPTEDMEAIEVTCEGCGNIWLEPNEKYVRAKIREFIDIYYSQFVEDSDLLKRIINHKGDKT